MSSTTDTHSLFWHQFCERDPRYQELTTAGHSEKDALDSVLESSSDVFEWANDLRMRIQTMTDAWLSTMKVEFCGLEQFEGIFNQQGSDSSLFHSILQDIFDKTAAMTKSSEEVNITSLLIEPLTTTVLYRKDIFELASIIRKSLNPQSPRIFRSTRTLLCRLLSPCLIRLMVIFTGVSEGLGHRMWISIGRPNNKIGQTRQNYLTCLKAENAIWTFLRALRILHDIRDISELSKMATEHVCQSWKSTISFIQQDDASPIDTIDQFVNILPPIGGPFLEDHKLLPKSLNNFDHLGVRVKTELLRIVETQGDELFGDVTRRIEPILTWLLTKLTDVKGTLTHGPAVRWIDSWLDQGESDMTAKTNESILLGHVDVDEVLRVNVRPALKVLADKVLYPRWQLFLLLKLDANRNKFHRIPIHVKNAASRNDTRLGLHKIIDELFIDDVESAFDFLRHLNVDEAAMILLEMSRLGEALVDEDPEACFYDQEQEQISCRLPWVGKLSEASAYHPEGLSWYAYWLSLEASKIKSEWTLWANTLMRVSDVSPTGTDDIRADEGIKLAKTLACKPSLALRDLMLTRYPNLYATELPCRLLDECRDLLDVTMRRVHKDFSHHAQESYLGAIVSPLIRSIANTCKILWNVMNHDTVDQLLAMSGVLRMLHQIRGLSDVPRGLQEIHLRPLFDPIEQLFTKASAFYADSLQGLLTNTPTFLISEAKRLMHLYDDAAEVPSSDRGILYTLNNGAPGLLEVLRLLAPFNTESEYSLSRDLFDRILTQVIQMMRQPLKRQQDLLPRYESSGRTKSEQREVEKLHRFFKHSGMTLLLDLQRESSGTMGHRLSSLPKLGWSKDEKGWAREKLANVLGTRTPDSVPYQPSPEIFHDMLQFFAVDPKA